MVNVSEYGDIMLNAILDEWGRRKIDALLEDGTKIIIISGGQVYEIYVDAVSQSLATPVSETTYNIVKDAVAASQSVTAQESNFNINQNAVTQPLADVLVELIHAGIYEIYVDAAVQATAASLIQSEFGISPEAAVHVLAEVAVLKPAEVKVTRLFLILGDLAIQIQGS
ncbi:MAG: hypothetical protein ACP5LB_02605 [Candidatus Bathyarchaeia archaeon]